MIGKRERHEAIAAGPAANLAESDAVGQFAAGGSGGVNDWIVEIGAPQRIQPLRSVEDGGLRVAGDKARPARILQRVDGKDAHEFAFG